MFLVPFILLVLIKIKTLLTLDVFKVLHLFIILYIILILFYFICRILTRYLLWIITQHFPLKITVIMLLALEQ